MGRVMSLLLERVCSTLIKTSPGVHRTEVCSGLVFGVHKERN